MLLRVYLINPIALSLKISAIAILMLSYPLDAIAKTSHDLVPHSVIIPSQVERPFKIDSDVSRSTPPPPPVPEAPGGSR